MKKVIVALLGLFMCTMAWAISSPIEVLQNTSNQLISELQRNQATLKTKPQIVYGIVDQILLPHVDVESMSSKALGRAWSNATRVQQQAFEDQFVTLLVRTYSSALAQYTNERVIFLPLREDFNNQSYVEVKSRVIRESGPQINLNYRMLRVQGQWKLYDFSVDGVSIIESFRSQFVEELRQSGIDGLIGKLAQHNNQSD
ncbi:ABC transporter substrate-binding protein [Rickettsiella endosymbiont of Xylota segnis]|uniref:MlaC/ttg2D family ABC transporter substrate-binding protein n=1 Tax=Rickettsiella endosymbiont of Xylota segnis TaxID=3066238 RepID=UPI0030D43E64